MYNVSGCDPSNGDTVRLVDGPVNSAGRIEYCDNLQWHTICDLEWDDPEARVVCTELGFPSASKELLLASTVKEFTHYLYFLANTLAAVAVANSQFGLGDGTLLAASFDCNGDENGLNECTMNSEERSCTTVAGVVCFPGGYQQQCVKI